MQRESKKQSVRRMAATLWVAAALLSSVSSSADTYTWSTNTAGAALDGSGTWNTSTANWVGTGDVHTAWSNANGDTAAFGSGGSAGTVTLESGITIGGLLFNAGVTGAYTLAGGPLNLVSAPEIGVNNSAAIKAVVAGDGFTKTGAGVLTLSAPNTFTGDLVVAEGTLINTLRVDIDNPVAAGLGDMTFGGRMVTINPGAKLSINASDAMGAYRYKTPVAFDVNGGTLANGSGMFMSIGDVSLRNGAHWSTANGANPAYQAFNLRGAVTVSGTSGSFIDTTGTSLNALHLGGTTIPATTFDVKLTGDPVADLTVTAPLVDEVYVTGALIKKGEGRLILAADNSFAGGMTISDGTVQIGNGGTTGTAGAGAVDLGSAGSKLVFDRAGRVLVPGEVRGIGSLAHLGSGVVMLAGGNTYTGSTTVSNGILSVSGLIAGYNTPGLITVGPGAGLTVDPLLWNITALGSLLANASFAPNSLFGAGTISGNDTISDSLALPNQMGFVKTAPHVLTLSGNNSYAGGTFVMGGVLRADFGAGISGSTNVTLSGGSFSPITGPLTAALGTGAGEVNIVPGTASGFSAVDAALTVNLGGAGATLAWGSAPFNPGPFVLNESGANTNLTLVNGINLNASRTINVNADTAEISGVIANGTATSALTKGGAGTLQLCAPNTYTGGTTVNGGTLKLSGGDNRLSTAGNIALNPGTTLDLDGNSQSIASGSFSMATATTLAGGTINYKDVGWSPVSSATFKSGGAMNSPSRLLLYSGQALTIGSDAGATSFGGNAHSSANFVGVDLNSANYLTVNGGSLNFTNMAGGIGYLRIGNNGSTAVNPRGTLNLNNGAVNVGHSMNMGGRYDNNQNVACYGTATLNLNGGEMKVGTGTSTATANGINGWLYMGNLNPGTVSRSTINLNGGSLTLAQLYAGTYGTNTINFNGGTLRASQDNGTFISGDNLACNLGVGGAVIDTAGFTAAIQSHLTGLGPLVKQGAGTLVLDGRNTYSGVTHVNEGTLRLAGGVGFNNLKLHLDASDISTLAQNSDGSIPVVNSGDPVGYWGDLSLSAKPATQATAARRPTYKTNVAEFNGMPVLEFDGADDDITSLLDINASKIPNMTIMMVCRQVSYKNNGGLWGHDNGDWDRLQLLNFSNTRGNNRIAGNNESLAVNGMNTNAVLIYSAVLRDGVTGGSYLYIDGASGGSAGLPAFTSKEVSTGHPYITLANISAGNSYRGHIQIGEVMVFDAALSARARVSVESYLRDKWLGVSDPVPPILQAGSVAKLEGGLLDGLALHLDASELTTLAQSSDGTGAVTTTGDPIGYWGDLSSSDLPATQAAAASRPVYKAAVAEFNGLPVLQFDGANDQLTSQLNINAANIPEITILMVYRKLAVSISGGLWGHDDGGYDRFQLLDYNAAGANNIATAGSMTNVKGMNNSDVLIYTAKLKNGVAGGSVVYINGVADDSTGLPAFTSSEGSGQPSFTLACIGANKTDFYGNIQIGEVLVYNSALSDEKRSAVEYYLRDKWVDGVPGIIEVASGAVLDLDGALQTLTSVSGSGTVANGTLTVNDEISPAGSAIGTLGLSNLSVKGTFLADVATDGASDCLVASNDTDLSGLTLQVVDTTRLVIGQRYTIVTCTGNLIGSFVVTNLEEPWIVKYDRTPGAATAKICWQPAGSVILVK